MLNLALLSWVNLQRMYFAALFTSAPPVYSGKYLSSGTFGNLTLKRSILFRKSYSRRAISITETSYWSGD